MAQETYAVVLRLVNPEVNKGFSVSYTLPNTNKATTFHWNEKNKFEAEIPTKVTYVDDHKKTVVWKENYALDLLNAYGVKKAKKEQLRLLEFVKELKRDVFDASPFEELKTPKAVEVEEPKVESVAEPEKKKGKEK